MQIRDMMNLNYARIPIGSSMCEAADVFATSQASDLMVVDDEDCFVGVLSEGDLIRDVMPKFEDLMFSSGTFVDRFDEFTQTAKAKKDEPIDALVIRKPLTYSPDDDALKAAATMVAKQIRRLPVVEDGRLVGVVSRADVCRTIFAD